MPSTTGKRKRDTAVVSRSTKTKEASPPPVDNAQDIFRKYFEAQFEPIEPPKPDADSVEDEAEIGEEELSDAEGSDWDGISGEEEEDSDEESYEVEIVEHKDAKRDDLMDKKARKAFMNSRPPSLGDVPTKTAEPVTKEEEEEDKDNFKHDLALQRLLRESHLLEDASDLAPTGKNRLKALDLRMQSLGAKTSLYDQKMPDAHRRGIKSKAASKDAKRRLEAKENGIILEKPSKITKSNSARRERGIGGSSIGKFSGAHLEPVFIMIGKYIDPFASFAN
ncbi:uncharacterized protein N7503_011002 [Penicillium pulvis]|uniref:uncharacterized protein n=1 Tax=Penicillium pulvis TaxID=1562058 RepID=UPI002549AD6F|nr:uncharacterized protein N7503_011002 [Penicillium pulvis]KAJ5785790.1 hypothetical protein N7503_011002 [Penicillium pulvis]